MLHTKTIGFFSITMCLGNTPLRGEAFPPSPYPPFPKYLCTYIHPKVLPVTMMIWPPQTPQTPAKYL